MKLASLCLERKECRRIPLMQGQIRARADISRWPQSSIIGLAGLVRFGQAKLSQNKYITQEEKHKQTVSHSVQSASWSSWGRDLLVSRISWISLV